MTLTTSLSETTCYRQLGHAMTNLPTKFEVPIFIHYGPTLDTISITIITQIHRHRSANSYSSENCKLPQLGSRWSWCQRMLCNLWAQGALPPPPDRFSCRM